MNTNYQQSPLTVLRIGGVPEHFKYPWHAAIAQQLFEPHGFTVKWVEFPGGTGDMNKALRANEVDMAMVLTEGATADIINGNPSRIIGTYVQSPLIWGVHTLADSPYNSLADLQNRIFCISRPGSGSQLMAMVAARQQAWQPENMQFKTVGNLQGAIDAMKANEADCLLWEKFTTKPWVDQGILKRVDEVLTPWSCFMLVATQAAINTHYTDLVKAIEIVHQLIKNTPDEELKAAIAKKYSQQPQDVETWFAHKEWSCQTTVDAQMIDEVQDALLDINLIPHKVAFEKLTYLPHEQGNRPSAF